MTMIMKHYILYIIAALTLVMGTSCVKEESGVRPSGDGGEMSLSLDVLAGGMRDVIVKSRWDANDDNEKAVYNLRVYIFSESGKLVGYGLFGQLSTAEVTDGYNATVEHIHTQTGDKVYIYGIANATTSQYWVTDKASILNIEDVSSSTLTREQFLSATYTRQTDAYDPRDNQFLMTGYVNDGSAVTIERKAGTNQAVITGVSEDAQRLKLYKVMSKNRIEVKTAAGVTFTPDYMAIHNMPSTVALMRELPSGDEALRPAAGDFETFDRIVLDENSLTFYLPENLQESGKTVGSFNEREKNSYQGDVKSFDNAPANATYLVIHGRYSSSDYTGNVNYTVHLGDFSKNMSDFDVVRNYNYSYTVTIKGVKNFIAESKCEEDKFDHGSEGIIINTTTGELLDVDCHYEARVMTFRKSELKTLIAENFGYILKIKTAFCETKSLLVVSDHTINGIDVAAGIYDAADYKDDLDSGRKPELLATIGADGAVSDESALLLSGEPDFGWVHFVQNTGTRSTYNTSGRTQTHAISEVCAYPDDRDSRIMSVFQFFQKLYAATVGDDNTFFNQDNGETVYVTCFIDENYYDNKNWADFVNKTDDRVMYCANTFDTSEDGKSSYAEAKYVISQKSIWTFYSSDVNYPFGIETVSEEEVVRQKNSSFRLSGDTNRKPENWNGRASAVYNNVTYTSGNRNKYNYSVYRNVGTQDMYTDPYKACMSRNRDENGNGKIDADEVKWYLAAVDEYKGIWAGEDILPTEAKLFQPTEANWTALNRSWNNNDDNLYPWHYFTASSQNTFWAEEGCSTGDNRNAAKARCIRTLENNGAGLRDADEYYSYETANTGSGTSAKTEYTISLRLANGATRSYQGSAQEPTYERGEGHNNRLFSKFKVATDNIGTYTRSQILNASNGDKFITANEDVCQTEKGEGWRVPTQRELSVMTAVIATGTLLPYGNTSGSYYLWSSTSFTGLNTGYYKNGSGAAGFVYLSNGKMTIAPQSYGYVRCVMDVQD